MNKNDQVEPKSSRSSEDVEKGITIAELSSFDSSTSAAALHESAMKKEDREINQHSLQGVSKPPWHS